jgi:hypothetical protein
MKNLTGKDPVTTAIHKMGSVDFLRSGAYVNLNDIAKPFGKRVDNWMRLKGTKDLFDTFRNDPSYNGAQPIYAVKGLADLPSHLRYGLQESHGASLLGYGGTFAHPDVGIQFAQWCSPGFALWVSRQIRHLMTYGEVNLHYTEWSASDRIQGQQYNRDDINDLYYR